jgi:cyclic beta-1,2-glucan synthetase
MPPADPPLVHTVPSAGYIQAYPPGVRENGGQYSHAAVWALMAQAAMAKCGTSRRAAGDRAWRDFTWLSPAHRSRTPGTRRRLRPGALRDGRRRLHQPPYVGRGGWSWYTGAAAWMHRAAIESIFGLRLGPRLSFGPACRRTGREAELTLRRDGPHACASS